jgi:hypothetical protein
MYHCAISAQRLLSEESVEQASFSFSGCLRVRVGDDVSTDVVCVDTLHHGDRELWPKAR